MRQIRFDHPASVPDTRRLFADHEEAARKARRIWELIATPVEIVEVVDGPIDNPISLGTVYYGVTLQGDNVLIYAPWHKSPQVFASLLYAANPHLACLIPKEARP